MRFHCVFYHIYKAYASCFYKKRILVYIKSYNTILNLIIDRHYKRLYNKIKNQNITVIVGGRNEYVLS